MKRLALAAALFAVLWLSRRLQGLPMAGVIRTTVRVTVASLPAALVAVAVVWLSETFTAHGRVVALIALAVGGTLFVLLYIAAARRMRVREIDSVLQPMLRRVRGARGRKHPAA